MPGVITSTSINANNTLRAREEDFVTRFAKNWDLLRAILGIMRPIKKNPGTQLVSYTAKMTDETLQGGTNVDEGAEIPATQFAVEAAYKEDVEIAKYRKKVSIEAVAKWGAAIAIEKTDDEFLVELQNKVMGDFYKFLKTGTLKGTQKTWQRALAIAKGAVLDKFAGMSRTVTDVVGFANIMDLYEYLGDADITVQSVFGLQYVKDFLGYSVLFLLPDAAIPSKTVIATPVENIDLYYIDPSDSDFAKLGLVFTVDGETNLIGFHAEGNYGTATGESFAIMGLKLWAEFLDGIAIVTVGSSNSLPTVQTPSSPSQAG